MRTIGSIQGGIIQSCIEIEIINGVERTAEKLMDDKIWGRLWVEIYGRVHRNIGISIISDIEREIGEQITHI